VTIRFAGRLVVFSLLISAATATAECSWSVRWPSDHRIWAIPWGTVPPGSFATKSECERAIQNMLQEAIRGQALLVEMPACRCVPGRDDLAGAVPRPGGPSDSARRGRARRYRSFPE
jgi:hypothetical protein